MLAVLLDSPWVLAALIAILWFLNLAIGKLIVRYQSRQEFVEADDPIHGPSDARSDGAPKKRRRSWGGQLPFLLTIVAVSLTLSADPVTREIFGGGGMVMLVAFVTLNIAGLLSARALLRPAAAEGRIRFTTKYVNSLSGAHTTALALFSGIVGILFGSLAFLAGSFFLLATAIGYYRRARKASRFPAAIRSASTTSSR